MDLPHESLSLRVKARCARRGWDLRDLAEQAGISRTTLYHLLEGRTARPHGATLGRLAEAFDTSVEELLADLPPSHRSSEEAAARFDRATNPQVDEVARDRPGLFAAWSPDDWDELYSTFGAGGALTRHGVVAAAEAINRKREIIRRLHIVLETHLRVVAEELVDTLYRMVRPAGTSAAALGAASQFGVPLARQNEVGGQTSEVGQNANTPTSDVRPPISDL
jgi:transcriptional regulator with XRE-family HTH domain